MIAPPVMERVSNCRQKKTMPKTIKAGYKGKGMCAACVYSYKGGHPTMPDALCCKWYNSLCRLVCRNCSGAKVLKDEKLKAVTPLGGKQFDPPAIGPGEEIV